MSRVSGWVGVCVSKTTKQARTYAWPHARTHRVLVKCEDAEVDIVARECTGQYVERDGNALVLLLYLFVG